jgi:hypothetical protein
MQTTPFIYIECSIPAGVTIDQFRRARPRPLTRWQRLLGVLQFA